MAARLGGYGAAMMCAHRATVLYGKGLRDDQAAELI